MKFRNQFEKQPRYISPNGSKEVMDYEKRLDSKGRTVIKPKGLKNIYDKIQAHNGEDIKTMIKKLSKQEQKQFHSAKDVYFTPGDVYDLREMPTSMPQAIQMAADAKLKFDQLPLEIKKEFNSNFKEFHAAVGSKEFEEKINKHLVKPQKIEETIIQPKTETQTTQTTQENSVKETL